TEGHPPQTTSVVSQYTPLHPRWGTEGHPPQTPRVASLRMASLNVGHHFGYRIAARSLRIALTEAKLPPKRCRKLAEMYSGSKITLEMPPEAR
ncbi:MAG: hypothetical protein IKR44_01440, partial [Bacteroidales bacterium]|nr:hypothetical protein [Bacteroidales bacterium]